MKRVTHSLLLLLLLLASAALSRGWVAPAAAEPARGARRHGAPRVVAPAEQAEALLALSERQNLDSHSLALGTARQALALWEAAGDRDGAARARTQLARYHMARSDLAEAAEEYQRALGLRRELGQPETQARLLVEMGYVEARKGEWAQAFSYMTGAENLLAGTQDPALLGAITLGLAYVFNESGAPEAALELNRKALDYYRQTPGERDDAFALIEVGSTHYLLENHAEALRHFNQALGILAAGAPDSIDAALCHHQLGKVYLAAGAPDAALRHLETALPVYVRAGNRREAAEVRALVGQVEEQRGRVEAARLSYRQALASFESLSDRLNEASVRYALGRLELKGAHYDAAEEHLRRSIEVTENVRSVPASSDLTASFSSAVHERYEKYVECLMRRHAADPARGLDARAFETSELARARSLAELLRDTQTSLVPGLDPEQAAREKSLRQSLRVKEDYRVALLSRGGGGEELAALDAELAQLRGEHLRVGEEIAARHTTFGRMTRPAGWDLRRIQQEVVADGETVLLEYELGADRSYVWAVTREGFESHELPAEAEVKRAVRKVYDLLSVSPSGGADTAELTNATGELARLVLAPVAAALDKRRVIVVADGALNYIPFQTLPASPGGEPLVAAHEVVNAPSASILGELRQEAARRRPAPKVLAAFGDPVVKADYARRKESAGGDNNQFATSQPGAAGGWLRVVRDIELKGDRFDPESVEPLIYAKRELANLGEVAGAGESFVAADFAATRDKLLGADLSEYSVLHIATHGYLDPRRPENSGLLLSTVDREGRAQNGFVGLQDVYGLRAPVDLVVLSACSTALGKDVRGEGLLGLTRGFMYAGASSVVASLWKVDDEATAELMKQFYANMLQRGMTPAAALREAQNTIRQDPRWRSPFYWAAFTLQGEHTRPIRRAGVVTASPVHFKVAAAATPLALLACAALWLTRRRRLRRASSSSV